MPVNKIIQKADYNDIRTKVVNVLGSGSGNSGYGQVVISSAVAEGTTVTINEWADLQTDILNATMHQTGIYDVTLTSVAIGGTIRSSPTFQPYEQYNGIADTLVTNRFIVAATQSFTTTKGTTSRTWSATSSPTNWKVKIECNVTVAFTTATAARYFFNSGGEIRFSSGRSGGAASAQNIAWTSLLSTAGTQGFGGNKPGTGTTPMTGQNYYRLTNTYTTAWYVAAASSPYTLNRYAISARTPAVADNSTGTASTIEFLIEWFDGYLDPGPTGPSDLVDGTITLAVTTLEASGVLYPVLAGNFVVESPTITMPSTIIGT